MAGIVPVGHNPFYVSESAFTGGTTASSSATALSGLTESGGAESVRSLDASGAPAAASASPMGSFGSFLADAVDQANRLDQAAARKVDALAAGASDDLHGTMISAKEAEISIKLVGTVRSKLLDAFQELWRTSV
ncbi:MAG: flagellar hook-basal body complex protein FliE [Myxococcales bacterium]|nr:flagellar hook-basal body complex protein FliE [Myxococcales bacterium]